MHPPTSSCTNVWAGYTHLTYEETEISLPKIRAKQVAEPGGTWRDLYLQVFGFQLQGSLHGNIA